MRTVVAYVLVSADGAVEAPEQFVADFDEVMSANLGAVIARQDAVLLGRATYDEWSVFWPPSDIQPFADFVNGVDKHVATSAPLTGQWAHTAAIEGPVEDFVRDLKGRDGGDIGIHGSITLVQRLLAAGIVDELQLVVAPYVVGAGRRLFDGAPPHALELLSSAASPSGSLLLHYAVTDRA